MFKLGKLAIVWRKPSLKPDRQERFTRFENGRRVTLEEQNNKFSRFENKRVRDSVEFETKENSQSMREASCLVEKPTPQPEMNLAEHLYSEEPISLNTLRNALPMRFAESATS